MPAVALALLLAGAEARSCPKRPDEVAGAPISIENRSGQSIYNLYAAPKGRGWGCDRLDDFTIPRGGSRAVAIFHPRGRCDYRVKLVLADRSERVRRIDACRGGRWLVSPQDDRFEPPADKTPTAATAE
jgi:hypothetical protein